MKKQYRKPRLSRIYQGCFGQFQYLSDCFCNLLNEIIKESVKIRDKILDFLIF
jgi:hypothetical protein